jgi:hypothetical protein
VKPIGLPAVVVAVALLPLRRYDLTEARLRAEPALGVS